MTRATTKLTQPLAVNHGRTNLHVPFPKPEEQATDAQPVDPLLKSFSGNLKDKFRAELGEFFSYVEVELNPTAVIVKLQRIMESLTDEVMFLVNSVLKRFHSLEFEVSPREFVIRRS